MSPLKRFRNEHAKNLHETKYSSKESATFNNKLFLLLLELCGIHNQASD
jgi:hypothetical protein